MEAEDRVDVVLIGSGAPIDGSGTLWKAVDGAPIYRRIVDVTDPGSFMRTDFADLRDVWTGRRVLGPETPAPEEAKGLVMVGQEGAPGYEEEFTAWIHTEHVPAFAVVPGVLMAARYEAVDSSPGQFALYYLESLAVCETEAWIRAGQTPWRARMDNHKQNRVRGRYEALG